jgi:hypothetical protein
MGAVALTDDPALFHFTVATARGREQDDVATLLRRVATALDQLGGVDVHDITYHVDWTDEGFWPSMTVYYEVDDEPAGALPLPAVTAMASPISPSLLPPSEPPAHVEAAAPAPSTWGMNVFALDHTADAFIGRATDGNGNGNGNGNGDGNGHDRPAAALVPVVVPRTKPFPLRDRDAFDQRALRRLKDLWRATNDRRRASGRY